MASATSHTGMHTKARQALSDTATHHHPGTHARSRQVPNDTASHHSSTHTKPRLAVSDTAAHQHGNQSTHETYGNHANNNSNRKPAISRHLGPVRGEFCFYFSSHFFFFFFLFSLFLFLLFVCLVFFFLF